jgi:hypothetical protein
MASTPDIRQDTDLRIRIPAHWPDVRHETTDQKVGGSSPSERAQLTGRFQTRDRPLACPVQQRSTATGGRELRADPRRQLMETHFVKRRMGDGDTETTRERAGRVKASRWQPAQPAGQIKDGMSAGDLPRFTWGDL